MIAPKQQQRAQSRQQQRVPTPQATIVSRGEYSPRKPPNALILSSVSITTATWLIIGGVVSSSKQVADSEAATVVIVFCCIIYFSATILTFVGLGHQYEGSVGPAWVSGMLGLGIGGFYGISASEAIGRNGLFWTLSGMQAGWLIEWTLHPIGRFLGHHEYPYTSVHLHGQAAMATKPQDGAPRSTDDTSKTAEGPIWA